MDSSDLRPAEAITAKDPFHDQFVSLDLSSGTARPRTLEDFYEAAQNIRLHEAVPPEIREHFQTARYLLIYSWYCARFLVTAHLSACTSVEYALRLRTGDRKTHFAPLLERALLDGWISDRSFSVPRARNASFKRYRDSLPQELRGPEMEQVDSYTATLAKALPQFRNRLAHGTTATFPDGAAFVRTCAELINQLFPALPEAAPEHKPVTEPVGAQGEIVSLIGTIQNHVAKTAADYLSLNDTNIHASVIPFFGDLTQATVVTIGLNPSLSEFVPARQWPSLLSPQALTSRCTTYFTGYQGLPDPNPWFDPWSAALSQLNVTYPLGSAAHLDISPRPTRFPSDLSNLERALFRKMVEADLPFFFRVLAQCRNAKLLILAGSVTNRYYINEFIHKYGPTHGYHLAPNYRRQPGRGNIAWHTLRGPGFELPVFFCTSSPSDRRNRYLLAQRVAEHVTELYSYL